MSDPRELLAKYASNIRVPSALDRIYKDECVYSYDTSESPDGLFVCLKTFICVGRENLERHFRKTQSHLYLHIKTHRIEVKQPQRDEEMEPEKKKPTKLAIGVEGGFDTTEPQFTFEHEYSLFIWPEQVSLKLPENDSLLSEDLRKSIDTLIKAESITYKEELESQMQSWDGEVRFVSKHAENLYQTPNPPKVPPSGWKCEKCDKRDNLWLNLSDGKILCGRKQLDGSGGNNHAIEYYQQSKYPLAVKLGTITAQGKADVYSYDEDDMVEDPNLAIHLAHFGINVKNMQKTEKTMSELEIDLNQKVGEWDLIQEAGCKLKPVYGAGFTGMRNLGNSCYMNSVMQMLFSLPEFHKKYFNNAAKYFDRAPTDPSSDFNTQMAKLAHGLLSGKYSKEATETERNLQAPKGIKPQSFKSLIGRGHHEFSTKRQQDAHEFYSYLCSLIERNCRNDPVDPSNPIDCFKFQLEDKIQCLQSQFVRYTKRPENFLSLPVAKEAAVNTQEYQNYLAKKRDFEAKGEKMEPSEIVRPLVPLMECFKLFNTPEIIQDFYSSVTKTRGEASKSTRFATFPDYLLIQMRKFELSPDWTPVKLDVAIEAPDEIDLGAFRGYGLQSGENEMVDEAEAPKKPDEDTYRINEAIVNQIMDMGFSLEGSKRAAYFTRELNDLEAAVNYAVTHMEDADFNEPFQVPTKAKTTAPEAKFDEEAIASIMSWGFTRQQAIKALKATNNNLERAADWIFSHTDEIMGGDGEESGAEAGAGTSAAVASEFRDGSEKYRLVAFVSHMGSNANVGHYVVHILKDGKWCIYNDQNVCESEKAHKELAYLYLYQRV